MKLGNRSICIFLTI